MCEAHWRWHSHDTDGTLPGQAVASTKGQRIQASGASMSRHAGSAIRLQLPPARPQGHLYNISVAIGGVDWNGGCGDAEDVRAVDRRERMCNAREAGSALAKPTFGNASGTCLHKPSSRSQVPHSSQPAGQVRPLWVTSASPPPLPLPPPPPLLPPL